MAISRRRAIRSIPVFALAGTAMLHQGRVTSQDLATPDAMPDGAPEAMSCRELIGTPVTSDAGKTLLDALVRTPVNTPLFPADTGTVRPEPWLDECDTDLIGTVGGVLMQTDQDEYGNFIGPGVYIVFPDEVAARTRLDEQRADAEAGFEGIRAEVTSIELAGHPGIAVREPESVYVIVTVGQIVVAGLGDIALPGDPMLRAHVNCLALLDHLNTVMS